MPRPTAIVLAILLALWLAPPAVAQDFFGTDESDDQPFDLTAETLDGGGIVRMKELQGDRPLQPRIVRTVDPTHAAGTEEFLDIVARPSRNGIRGLLERGLGRGDPAGEPAAHVGARRQPPSSARHAGSARRRSSWPPSRSRCQRDSRAPFFCAAAA